MARENVHIELGFLFIIDWFSLYSNIPRSISKKRINMINNLKRGNYLIRPICNACIACGKQTVTQA